MHPDVAKLVEAGRIPKPVGERLSQLAPGNFCVHKIYGAGKVVGWDLPAKRVVIDFEKAQGQTMDLQFAFQKTEWIPADDFRARKIEEIEELRSLSQSDPVKMVVHLLQSHGGAMSVDAMERELSGTVIPAKDFKKWWDATKVRLKETRATTVPAKRTEPIQLRATDISPAQALVGEFAAARDIKGKVKALEAITADISAFAAEPDALKELIREVDEAARKASRIALGQAFQLVAARDEVLKSCPGLELQDNAVQLAELVSIADPNRIADEVSLLPTARQRAVFESFPHAFGPNWVAAIVQAFNRVGARGVTEIARLLSERNEIPALATSLKSGVARRALGADALIWVCRERKHHAADVFCADVGAAVLNLLEDDHLSDGPRKTSRLQSLLGDDKTLLTDLVETMDINEARNFARRLLDCPVFAELEKKSLMARIIKTRPETAELVSGGQHSKRREEPLLVSWESLERKKNELDELIRVRIPQNTKDISIARSYGDLRENFEYKSAREMQKYLMHRQKELEREIQQARGSDFKAADASKVNIGTVVTLKDDNGSVTDMCVLGAWDSDPEKQIVSYLSEVGKALVGRSVGEVVTIRDGQTESDASHTIIAIRPFNP